MPYKRPQEFIGVQRLKDVVGMSLGNAKFLDRRLALVGIDKLLLLLIELVGEDSSSKVLDAQSAVSA